MQHEIKESKDNESGEKSKEGKERRIISFFVGFFLSV